MTPITYAFQSVLKLPSHRCNSEKIAWVLLNWLYFTVLRIHIFLDNFDTVYKTIEYLHPFEHK